MAPNYPAMPVVNPSVKPFGYVPPMPATPAPQQLYGAPQSAAVPMPQTPQVSTGSNVPPMPANYGSNIGNALGSAGVKPFSPLPAIPNASTGGSNVPAMPANNGTPVPQMSAQSNSVPVPQMPQRWNVDAPYQERLAHFSDPNNIADAQQELLAIKGIYGDRAGAGNLTGQSGAWAAHDWADQVRAGAGISNDHPVYGNAPTPIITGDVTKPATPTSNGGGYAPNSGTPAPMGQLTPQQIADEAAVRIAKQRFGVKQSVDYAKTGLRDTRDYTQGRLQDARQLENTAFQRTNDPFNGHTDYLAADMLRNRSIADTASEKDYNAQVAAQDQKLADFDSMAPQQQSAMIDELTRLERQFGLDAGQLTGVYNSAPTLAAKTADQNYQLGLSGQSGKLPVSAGGGPTLAAQQFQYGQQQDAIKNSASYTGYVPDGKGGLTATTAEQERQLNNLWKAADQSGSIPNELADMYGIPRGTQTQAAKQFAQSLSVQQQNANSSSSNATTSANAQKVTQLMDVWKTTGKAPAGLETLGIQAGESYSAPLKDTDVADLIDKSPMVKKQYDDNGKLVGTTVEEKDKNSLMLYIKALPGMTAEKALPWFRKYGLYSGN